MPVPLNDYDFTTKLPENLEHKDDQYYNPTGAVDTDILLSAITKYILSNIPLMRYSVCLSIEYVIPGYTQRTYTLFIKKNPNMRTKYLYIGNHDSDDIVQRYINRSSTNYIREEDGFLDDDDQVVPVILDYLEGNYIASIVLCQVSYHDNITPIEVLYENKSMIGEVLTELRRNDNILIPVQEENLPGGLCPICLSSSIRDGFCMIDCPRGHIFHCECIQTFVQGNIANGYEVTCPRCKANIREIAPVVVPENLLSPEDKDDPSNEFGKHTLTDKIKKLAKKYKIKTTIKRNGRRVPKSLKLIKSQIKNKMA